MLCRRCLTEGRRSSGRTPASTCGGTFRWPSCSAGSGPGDPWTLADGALMYEQLQLCFGWQDHKGVVAIPVKNGSQARAAL